MKEEDFSIRGDEEVRHPEGRKTSRKSKDNVTMRCPFGGTRGMSHSKWIHKSIVINRTMRNVNVNSLTNKPITDKGVHLVFEEQ